MRRWAAVGALLAGALGTGCDPWHCSFDSHGACIEFETPPQDLAAAQSRVDRLLELELPYWGLHRLSGWRVQFRDGAHYVCYLSSENEGCTDYLQHTLSVQIPPEAPDCFEASELLHELGHYELGDPMHASHKWAGLEEAFAGIVWDRPDAPAECVDRYQGVRQGMWTVDRNQF